MSGGQKKRVNIALELLTKPSVLFLDEPTSSLDVELKEDVVDIMRELVNDGRTVVMVTHDLEYLDKCDRVLVLGPGGRMAFYGPSEEGLGYFGRTRWVEVYRAFGAEPERDWAGEFQRSSCYQQYVAPGLTGPVPQAGRGVAEPPPAPRSRLTQLAILCRRSGTLIAVDRGFLLTLIGMPVVFGILIRLCAGAPGLRGPANARAETTLLMLVIIAAVTGVISSVRALIEERDIYRRERMAGLSARAYLLSKVVVLGLVAVVQAALLVLVGLAWRPAAESGRIPDGGTAGRADARRGRFLGHLDGPGPGRVGLRPLAGPSLAAGHPAGDRAGHADRCGAAARLGTEGDRRRVPGAVGLRRGRGHH